jgi:hypothetical protein
MSAPIPVGEARNLPADVGEVLWQLHTAPHQPPNWPFPAMDAIQARNHCRCVAELEQMAHRRRQQALRNCLQAWQAQEALL